MQFEQALSYLLSLGHETLTIKLGLRNTEVLLDALGNPQNNFPAVQIAGTNGKGSVAVFLDSICREAGIRTGRFTSPHLISITERIQINNAPIATDDFARFTAEVKSAAEQLIKDQELETLPTFFEHVTAISLLAFREAAVDLAILETGLGGRLDSTTAARADIVAITPVAMDHEEYLGNSIEEIAAEKAAIIRPGVTAVISPQDERPMKVIIARCKETAIDPVLVQADDSDRHVDSSRFCNATWLSALPDGRGRIAVRTQNDLYEDVLLGLRGRHQLANAATAVALAEALRERGFAISRDAIVKGLANATHAGRLELWTGKPPWLFDGAHNPAAAAALGDYLDEFVPGPITMIFGAMRDKRLPEMAKMLFPKAAQLILTEIDNPRAAESELLKAAVPAEFDPANIHFAQSVREALTIAREITPADGLICVTGSLYLVGEALREVSPPG